MIDAESKDGSKTTSDDVLLGKSATILSGINFTSTGSGNNMKISTELIDAKDQPRHIETPNPKVVMIVGPLLSTCPSPRAHGFLAAAID